jgi:FlaA1/EpsC-like NDP-sugar epimerase
MGATKRLAEEICLGLGNEGATVFQVVRFGNVLGSSGSVVPLFERQLAAGGPLTVTHPEVTRFFMTIPEAARLILQAVVMGRQGEIFLLEMGEPVKIVDLAEQMIRLAGKEPYSEVPIQFVGLRPGEKLHEELWRPDEQFVRTVHPKILRADSPVSHWQPAVLLSEVRLLLQLSSGAVGPAVVALANWSLHDQKQEAMEKSRPSLTPPAR